jgi:hypothetical protein
MNFGRPWPSVSRKAPGRATRPTPLAKPGIRRTNAAWRGDTCHLSSIGGTGVGEVGGCGLRSARACGAGVACTVADTPGCHRLDAMPTSSRATPAHTARTWLRLILRRTSAKLAVGHQNIVELGSLPASPTGYLSVAQFDRGGLVNAIHRLEHRYDVLPTAHDPAADVGPMQVRVQKQADSAPVARHDSSHGSGGGIVHAEIISRSNHLQPNRPLKHDYAWVTPGGGSRALHGFVPWILARIVSRPGRTYRSNVPQSNVPQPALRGVRSDHVSEGESRPRRCARLAKDSASGSPHRLAGQRKWDGAERCTWRMGDWSRLEVSSVRTAKNGSHELA